VGEGQTQSRTRQQAANAPLPHGRGSEFQSLQVRIGIHTGLVVVGEMGGGEKREQLALGDTPNIAARVQGIAEPDTVVISAATQRLVAGLFECQDLGPQTLRGISTPLSVYRVVRESVPQSRFEVAVGRGLTPLVGREEELGLLRRRWEQAKEGAGQVVLLSGEAGIGKSRLVQTLKEQVTAEGATRIEFRCSPYHQNSAFYPIIEHLQRLLQFAPHDSPQTKLAKLQQTLAMYRFPQADTLPLLAALLSLPHPEGAAPLTLSPQKQKQRTQEALVAWIVEEAEKAPVYCAWEDLHWADPSTLELLTLYLEQIPTTRIFTVLTFRPEFTPPWGSRSYFTPLTLNRLGRQQVEAMVRQVTGGKVLPPEVLQQIVAKTDGVPLFVEELTKTVLESGVVREEDGRYVGAHGGAPIPPLAIPSTLQDSLMARLDRLAPVKEIAQLGATLGREFSYELLAAVSPLEAAVLQQGLKRLVEAELVYQRGLVPQAIYLFKHALIRDTAYQSLLKSKRQQLHQQIAQVLAERFPETVEIQPELLAHHYTEAGLREQAIPYWQQAGQRAVQRSANGEAISHLTKGLELLKALPDTPKRARQELALRVVLGVALIRVKGVTAAEVEHTYARAYALCQQDGSPQQLLAALEGLYMFHLVRGDVRKARELAEQQLQLTQRVENLTALINAHGRLGESLIYHGEVTAAHAHLEQAWVLYQAQEHNTNVRLSWENPGLGLLARIAWTSWLLGYPDQAQQRLQECLALAERQARPFRLAFALSVTGSFHAARQEWQRVRERAEEVMRLSTEQGFPYFLAYGTAMRGWALAEQGQVKEGIAQMQQGLASFQATGAELGWLDHLPWLARAYGKVGRVEEGLAVLTEALTVVDNTGARAYEAELYRLRGELLLMQEGYRLQAVGHRENTEEEGPRLQAEGRREKTEEAEECFLKAIEIACKQQAKSLELRATVSLARLWQQQGKPHEARTILSAIYNWFTEGFDTKDLQEAQALLEELSR
jgi:predicted ATPase